MPKTYSSDLLLTDRPQANLAMGIRMKTEVTEAENTGIGAFSEDILKIEVSGPEVRLYWRSYDIHVELHVSNISYRKSTSLSLMSLVFFEFLLQAGLLKTSFENDSNHYIGLTTETDITLVENMVKSYMSNTRTMSVPHL